MVAIIAVVSAATEKDATPKSFAYSSAFPSNQAYYPGQQGYYPGYQGYSEFRGYYPGQQGYYPGYPGYQGFQGYQGYYPGYQGQYQGFQGSVSLRIKLFTKPTAELCANSSWSLFYAQVTTAVITRPHQQHPSRPPSLPLLPLPSTRPCPITPRPHTSPRLAQSRP